MSLLSIRGLSLSIHGQQILHNVSLDVTSGKVLGVIGESGSGKSMTANAVMQLLPDGSDATGQILLDGQDILNAPERLMTQVRGNKMGMVFQEPMTALNPLKTVGDQVAEPLWLHRGLNRQAASAEARKILNRVGLPAEQFPLTRYPHALSGGQRQRVVIAIAMAARPQLLIADEPTTALDVTTQAQILKLLKSLVMEEGVGLILITHDLAVIADLADDIAIMRKGEVVETGPAKQVFRELNHPYSRALYAASTHAPKRAPKIDASDPPMLAVEGLCRDYLLPRKALFSPRPTFRAVDKVSFDLRRGESLGLVGESGCGKSTLARALLGLEPVQQGDIRFDGRSMLQGTRVQSDVRRHMQVVFQDPYGSFNPRHKVARLITEPFHLLPDPPKGAARERAVVEALEAVGMPADAAQKYPHEFSGGQRQRLAIARALIIKPDLILLDEAVSALDVSIRAQILDLLADLCAQQGLAYLFISHDLSVVRSITDRVMVMKAGQIVESGPTQRVFDAPEHAYTRELIAAAPRLPAAA